MMKTKMVDGLQVTEDGPIKFHCMGCAAGKMTKLPFPHASQTDCPDLLSVVHSDLAGPIRPATQGGKDYILTFVDDKNEDVLDLFTEEKVRGVRLLHTVEING